MKTLVIALLFVSVANAQEIKVSQLQARRELGRWVFFDKRMSLAQQMSCASCHDPRREYGYSNGHAIAVGAIGQQGTGLGLLGIRNTKSLLTVFNRIKDALNWDGRTQTLYAQCFQAIADPLVLGMSSVGAYVALVVEDAKFKQLCAYGYGDDVVTEPRLRDSMVHFIQTLRYDNLPADKMEAGLKIGMPAHILRGQKVFTKWCATCHNPATDWEDYDFHNIGVSARSPNSNDLGRGQVTGNAADNHKFRTQSLRGCPHTQPYFHDGSAPTLEYVVAFKANGGKYQVGNEVYLPDNIDPRIASISINDADQKDLVAYLYFGFQKEDYPFVEDPYTK